MKMNRVAIVASVFVLSGIFAQAEGLWPKPNLLLETVGGVWFVPDAEQFFVNGENYSPDLAYNIDFKVGLEFEDDLYVADIAGLVGPYIGPVVGVNVGADASFRFKVSEKTGSLAIGPHAGYNWYLFPTWTGDNDAYVEFENLEPGWMVGLKATWGSEKIRGVVSIDYVDVWFDAKDGSTVSKKDLSMQGLLLQGGIQF